MNVLITGGAGFIGSHLARKLIEQNIRVAIIDNLHPYYEQQKKRLQLDYVRDMGEFDFFKMDLLDEREVESVFRKGKFDKVVHLAALPGVAYSLEEPHQYIDYDIKATVNVLKWSGETNVSQVIFASSSSVYGDQLGVGVDALREEMANGKVVSPYAAAKYAAESFCHVYHSLYGFDMTIFRFFTVYGPWGRPDMAIPTFIQKLLKNQTITIFGEGTARDYTYIDDIVHGIVQALMHPLRYETINLGSGRAISMSTLLEQLRGHFPNMQVVKQPFRKGDVTVTNADIRKAKHLLGYQVKTSFEEGIAKTVDWFKQNS